MWARASGPRTELDDPAANLGVGVRILPVPDRHGHAWIALDRLELGAVHLGVDQDVVVVGVDPHHVGHRGAGPRAAR